MKQVWLLWGGDGELPWLEGVYVDKVLAESDLRRLNQLKDADPDHGHTHYYIQEKQITKETEQ